MELLKQTGVFASATSNSKHKKSERNSRLSHPSQHGLNPASNSTLPTLDLALDSVAMTPILRARLSSTIGQSGSELTVTKVELLDYKPNQRGLIRYELATPEGRECYTVFGKLYADPTQLARVNQVMDRLWADVFGGDIHCSVPQPIGVLPELSMLFYLPAEGQFLDEALTGERADYAMELTARWLGTLHNYPLPVTKQFHLAGELTNLATWAGIVGQTYPELATLAHQTLHYLQAQATRLPLATQTPIHKDFHYRHVLVERGVKVIDFDELRLGDPNFDLAHFCANLHLLAYRQHGSPHYLRHLEHRFLTAYARNTGWTLASDHGPRFTYFYLYTCLKLARQLCLGFGPSPLPTGEERRRQVHMILSQGAAAIAARNDGF